MDTPELTRARQRIAEIQQAQADWMAKAQNPADFQGHDIALANWQYCQDDLVRWLAHARRLEEHADAPISPA